MEKRKGKVYLKLDELNIDAILISHQPNIRYLTDWDARDSYMIACLKKDFLITDSRYIYEARAHLKNTAVKQSLPDLFTAIRDACLQTKVKRLGFESRRLPFAEYTRLKKVFGSRIKLIPVVNLIENQRKIKDDSEISKITHATQRTMEGFRFIKKTIRPGIKEYQACTNLEYFIRKRYKTSISFETIIASGPNSCMPHALVSDRTIRNNQSVLVDFGCEYQGYKSDLTRVFFLGKITQAFRRVYEIVLEAQARAIAKIKPGVDIKEIDLAARNFINSKGLGSYFTHSLGHGVGLEIHEKPDISSKSTGCLVEGMVFTVEPGIYLPNKFGIRLEDLVIVTEKGAKVISRLLKK